MRVWRVWCELSALRHTRRARGQSVALLGELLIRHWPGQPPPPFPILHLNTFTTQSPLTPGWPKPHTTDNVPVLNEVLTEKILNWTWTNNFVVSGLPCPVGEWEAPHKTCNYSCVMYYAAELENNEVIYRVITILHCLREQVYLSAPSSPLGGQTRETWENKQSSITPIFNKPGNSEWCCQKR